MGPHLQAMAEIVIGKVDHGLTAIARFAMDVLEEMHGKAAAAIEQRNITCLQIDQGAGRDFIDELLEIPASRFIDDAFIGNDNGQLTNRLLEIRIRVDKQRTQRLEGLGHQSSPPVSWTGCRGPVLNSPEPPVDSPVGVLGDPPPKSNPELPRSE